MLVPVMKKVRFDNGAVEVDAALIAAGLGIAPEQVQADMRAGRITSACERGVDEDAGTFRLSFFAGNRRLRLTVDAGRELTRRSTVRTGDPPR